MNLVVRALKPDYLLLDIFLHLRSETWTKWTIEAARVKVHHRPYSFRMVWWCIRLTRLTLVCEVIRYHLVQVRQLKSKKDFSGWRPTIAFLYLFLFHSLLRLTSFLSQYKKWFQLHVKSARQQWHWGVIGCGLGTGFPATDCFRSPDKRQAVKV